MQLRAKFLLYAVPALLWAFSGLATGADLKAQPDRVAYMSWQPSNWAIYLFRQRGKASPRLTDYPGLGYDPVVSPDGRWLVFVRSVAEIQTSTLSICAVGGKPRLLIDSERMEDQAAFSPDGKFIFFVSTYSGNADIDRLPFPPGRTVSMKGAENLTHHPEAIFARRFLPLSG